MAPVTNGQFSFNVDTFYVAASGGQIHRRAAPPEIKALYDTVTIEKSTPDHPGHWYEAQLLHYGLPPSKVKATAKMRLLKALQDGGLSVPKETLQIEKNLKKEWKKHGSEERMQANTKTTTTKTVITKITTVSKTVASETTENKTATSKAAAKPAATKATVAKIAAPKDAARKKEAAPKTTAPKSTPAKSTATKPAASKAAVKASTAKATAPKTTAPKTTAPKTTAPKTTAPKTTAPKATAPKAATPKAATPKAATPKAATPKAATPKAATPKAAAPKKTTAPKSTTLKPTTAKTAAPGPATSKRKRATTDEETSNSPQTTKQRVYGGIKAEENTSISPSSHTGLSGWPGQRESQDAPPSYEDACRMIEGHYYNPLDDQMVIDSDGYGHPKSESSDPGSPPRTLKNTLGLLNGTYKLRSPDIEYQWPHQLPQEGMTLSLRLNGKEIWGTYSLGMFEGVFWMPERPMKPSFEAIPFYWRGRDTGEGEMSFDSENEGWIEFSGEGDIKGMINCCGNLTFRGKRINGSVRTATDIREEWDGYNESEYERERVSRWH
ncbi:hypothetical protein N7457_008251 [Penicillium paradoxum]|uniref:uncharacterized protein n=1 Tax=Penicillium paradoxum TaxID=176176 RepID=UPI0025489B44|nr:uncharacterized protein N7457_008251 [Penicillium paradoxum]KAJ5773355.1 hypothetical protein N7457_008251 [Penicillium paradoxum]